MSYFGLLRGSTDERRLAEIRYGKPRSELEGKRTIWTDNLEADYWKKNPHQNTSSDLGRIYGAQMRSWRSFDGSSVDQLQNVMKALREAPMSRRHVVQMFNPGEIDRMCLPPCHMSFQFYVTPVSQGKDRLSCKFVMRSTDVFLGLPYNMASYALLTHMVANILDMEVGELIFSGGDVHLYANHVDAAREVLLNKSLSIPSLKINRVPESLFDYNMDDFELVGYKSHSRVDAPMAV